MSRPQKSNGNELQAMLQSGGRKQEDIYNTEDYAARNAQNV